MTLTPAPREDCPRCLGPVEILLPIDLDGVEILVCRNLEHTLPLLLERDGLIVELALGSNGRHARRIARRAIDLEREVSEMIRTGRSTSDRIREHQGAGRTALPDGAVAGTRIGPDDYRQVAAEIRGLADELIFRGDLVDRDRGRRVLDRAARLFGEYQRTTDEWADTDARRRPPPAAIITAEDGNLGIQPLTEHPAEMTDAPRYGRVEPPILVDHHLPPNVVAVTDTAGETIASIDYNGATFGELEGSGIDEIAAGIVDAGAVVLGVGDLALNPPPDRLTLHSTSRLDGSTSSTGRPNLDVPCGACSCGWHGPFGHPNHDAYNGTHRWAEHLGRRVFVSECKATGPAIQVEVNGLRRLS